MVFPTKGRFCAYLVVSYGEVSNIFFIFTPNTGEMIQFDEQKFSIGLKPPTKLRDDIFAC